MSERRIQGVAECQASISNIMFAHKTEFLSLFIFKGNVTFFRKYKLVQVPVDGTELSRLVIRET